MDPASRNSGFMASIVLCAVALAPGFLPIEWSAPLIVLLGLAIWIMDVGARSFSYLRLMWPLLVVFIVGLHGVYRHELFHILRDITFALTPIFLIFIGYWMAGYRSMRMLILKLLIACSFVLAANHLWSFVLDPDLLTAEIVDVRKIAGSGAGNLVVLAFVLGLFQHQFRMGNLFFRLLPRFVVLPFIFGSIVLSHSRTEFSVLFIAGLAMSGWLTRIRFSSLVGVGAFALGVFVVVATTPVGEVGTFRSKLASSISEIAVANYQSDEDINTKWRGFETARVLKSFSDSSVFEQVFGQGFGALVELGLEMRLGDEYFREIPIFHNGYAYILIKVGLLGLVCYTFFYFYVLRYAMRYSNAQNLELRFLARLLLACALSLMVTMYVVGGMAEAHDSVFVLLIGYLLRRMWQYNGRLGGAAVVVKQ